jgi:hypothetical protein
MKIDRDMIVNLLHQRGEPQKAEAAARELPPEVDHEQHAGLLSKFGIDPQELLGKLPGNLGDKLGGLLGRE